MKIKFKTWVEQFNKDVDNNESIIGDYQRKHLANDISRDDVFPNSNSYHAILQHMSHVTRAAVCDQTWQDYRDAGGNTDDTDNLIEYITKPEVKQAEKKAINTRLDVFKKAWAEYKEFKAHGQLDCESI